jgi:hypothetical protein
MLMGRKMTQKGKEEEAAIEQTKAAVAKNKT